MLGITTGARKKGKPRMWWTDVLKSATGLSVNDKSVSERQEEVALISEQHGQKEKTDQYLIQGEGYGKPFL